MGRLFPLTTRLLLAVVLGFRISSLVRAVPTALVWNRHKVVLRFPVTGNKLELVSLVVLYPYPQISANGVALQMIKSERASITYLTNGMTMKKLFQFLTLRQFGLTGSFLESGRSAMGYHCQSRISFLVFVPNVVVSETPGARYSRTV